MLLISIIDRVRMHGIQDGGNAGIEPTDGLSSARAPAPIASWKHPPKVGRATVSPRIPDLDGFGRETNKAHKIPLASERALPMLRLVLGGTAALRLAIRLRGAALLKVQPEVLWRLKSSLR